jgi:hypothetical protein
VGSRAGLDDEERRKFLTLPGLELDPSVVRPLASRYTDYAIHTDTNKIRNNVTDLLKALLGKSPVNTF